LKIAKPLGQIIAKSLGQIQVAKPSGQITPAHENSTHVTNSSDLAYKTIALHISQLSFILIFLLFRRDAAIDSYNALQLLELAKRFKIIALILLRTRWLFGEGRIWRNARFVNGLRRSLFLISV
jgi:hypothetical protein